MPYTDGYLFGSLIRGTKKHPMDDVDYMFPLDGNGLFAIRNGVQIGKAEGALLSVNPLLEPKYKDENGLINSAKVMVAIRTALADSYPRSVVSKDGQAINVWLEAYGFGIDVVPAFHITPHDGSPALMYIPLGRGQSGWLSTNPRTDLAAYEVADVRLGGLLRPTARLAKAWNENQNSSRLGGFHMDLLALRAFPTGTVSSLSSMLTRFFIAAPKLIEQSCPQLTGFDPHVDSDLSTDDRAASVKEAGLAAQMATIAMQHELRGETRRALECWSTLLGEPVTLAVAT